MKLPFAGDIPSHYYSDQLRQLVRFFSKKDGELISVKVRPIDKWPIASDDEFVNAYMYTAEYKDISTYLRMRNLASSKVDDRVTVCKVDSDSEFLLVEHETGAEIIVILALATASVSLAKEIVSLTKVIIETINKKNEEKKKNAKSKARFHEAAAISIEGRTENEAAILMIVPLPLNSVNLELQPVEQALKRGKGKKKSRRKRTH